MKHSEKDKLEQFFQNSLENYGEDPSTEFWSELEDRIPPPPVSAPSFWKKYGLFGLLFLLVGMLSVIGFQKWNHNKALEDINKTMELQDQAIIEMSKELSAVQNKVSNNSADETDTKLNLEIQDEVSQQDIYKNEGSGISPNPPGISEVGFSTFENKSIVVDNANEKSGSNFSKQNLANSILEKESVKVENTSLLFPEVSELENISPLFFEAKFSKKKILEMPEKKIVKRPKVEIAKKGLEFFGGFHSVYPTLKIEDYSSKDLNNPVNLEANFGLLYSFAMSEKWAVQIGFGFGNSTHNVSLKKDLEYSSSEFDITDDIARTRYDLNFETNYNGFLGFQTFVDNYRLNDGRDIYSGDSFTAEITSTKRQKYLMIPIYLKYYVLTKSPKLKWSFRLGVIQRIAYFENEVAMVNFNNFSHPRLAFSHTNIVSISENQKRNQKTELVLGTGAEYLLSKNITLVLEPTFKKSTTLEGKIMPHTFGIFTAVRWNFL